MGEHDVSTVEDKAHQRAFTRALLDDVRALEQMLETGLIEGDVRRIGAEQEVFLVDSDWHPSNVGLDLYRELADGPFATELGLFNLEANLSPLRLEGDCLSRLELELRELLVRIEQAAGERGARVLLTGILPTLEQRHLSTEWMTPTPRYAQLNQVMRELRGNQFQTMIKGLDDLVARCDNVMLEACNTSFQVHFQVGPDEFARLYNLAQVVTAPVLAAAVNSPVLLQHRLWQETRVALFQQSLDVRSPAQEQRSQEQRVSFGQRWVDRSVLEIFREDISRFRILLHTETREPSTEVLARGGVPTLDALRLHNGTVYRWNRPCYGVHEGKPHLRIENRVLPAGPTVLDELANAAFFFGLMTGVGDDVEDVRTRMPFDAAKDNFNAAARYGLKASMRWFDGREVPVRQLILDELLPVARTGLRARGLDPGDVSRYLGVLEERVRTGRTGSQWALDSLEAMDGKGTVDERYRSLTAAISARQAEGKPVHTWPLAEVEDRGRGAGSFRTVRQVMTTKVFTVHPEDLVDLAASMMDWEHVRHVPVEDDDGRLVGLVSHRNLLRLVGRGLQAGKDSVAVREVMAVDPVTVDPDASTLEAIELMRRHRVGCLPVVRDGQLVGIVSERDFIEVSARLLEEHLRGR